MENKGDVYDLMIFSKSFYFLHKNFNVWIAEKHKIIDVPCLFPSQFPSPPPYYSIKYLIYDEKNQVKHIGTISIPLEKGS